MFSPEKIGEKGTILRRIKPIDEETMIVTLVFKKFTKKQ
jgi:hypothetical protein